MMSPTVTLERNNVVKFDTGHSFDAPRSAVAEKLDLGQSGLHKRNSSDIRSEREVQDLPRNAKDGLFTRLLSYKWKSGVKDDGKDLC